MERILFNSAGTIQEGNNRITSKLVCQANPASLTTFRSIYVTGMNVPMQHSAITPNNATVVHVSSSNLLHPRLLINHLSATTHSTSVVHVSNNLSSYPPPRLHSTGDSSSDSNKQHYHNISTSTYSGSSSSGDSSSDSNKHHYHNICAYIHHPDHGKSGGYPVHYDVGPGGSFGGGPGYYP